MAGSYREKREFARAAVDSDLTFHYQGKADEIVARAKNLSGQGMMFVVEKPVAKDALLEVTIHPRKAITPHLSAQVRVVRVTPLGPGAGFEIGVKIEKILA